MPITSWGTVEVFSHRGMAEVAGSALRSAGIPHRLLADDLGSIARLPIGGAWQGVELQVPIEHVEEARELLQVGVEIELEDRVPTPSGMSPLLAQVVVWTVLAVVIGGVVVQFAFRN